jgi:hypothetical protein
MILNYQHSGKRVAGVAKARLALAENIYYDPNPRITSVGAFVWANSENYLVEWSSKDQMRGELTIEERKLPDDFAYDNYIVVLTFKDSEKTGFTDFAEKYLRNRHVALELQLENGHVEYLIPLVCTYKYVVPQEKGSSNFHELTFTKAKAVDAFANLIIDDIMNVEVDCDSRIASITTKYPNEGYEFGVSVYNDIRTVTDWKLNGEITVPQGNGLVFVFVRVAGEQNGIYKSSRAYINCPYLGAQLQILGVTAEVDYSALVNFWEDVVTTGEDTPDPLQADWEDVVTTGENSDYVCVLEILSVVLS